MKVDEIGRFFDSLSTIGKREFSYSELTDVWRANSRKKAVESLLPICEAMFDCSAIGNITNHKGFTHYSFKYRNRFDSFNPDKRIMLHRGLWKSMNIR